MDAARLFAAFWGCYSLADGLAVIAKTPHKMASVGGRRNNKANVVTNSDGIAAAIEGVTNGHDATIRHWMAQKRFPKTPDNVSQALEHIAKTSVVNRRPRALVHVLMHLRHGSKPKGRGHVGGFADHHGLTIIDEGCGMDQQDMLNGPLTFGSEDKVTDPRQFGSFGQGSASLFGHSKFSIIASRKAGSDTVVFTVVWHDKTQDIHSFVYLTQPDGSLFSFDARRLAHAEPNDGLAALLEKNAIIIPNQGTIRRQLDMADCKEYWSTKDYGLYNGLLDRLFGVSAYVRFAGDDDSGHLNLRHGRQWELDAIAEGAYLRGHEKTKGAKMLKKLPPMKIALHRGTEHIGFVEVRTWVVSSWKRKQADKSITVTPARSLLEGPESALSRTIFVTYNGQTLERMPSTALFGQAGLRAISENTIMRVEIDQLDPALLQDAELFLSTREGLKSAFAKPLKDELIRFLRAQEELKIVAMTIETPDSDSEISSRNLNEINRHLANPIFGRGLGYGSDRASDAGTQSAMAGTNGSSGSGGNGSSKAKSVNGEITKHEKYQPKSIELIDPPTILTVRKRSVVRNGTNYIIVHTNAPDYYGSAITLELPKFLTLVDGGKLRNGRKVASVSCNNSKLGTVGTIVATLKVKGVELRDECGVEIVVRNEEPKKAEPTVPSGQARREEQAPPQPIVKLVSGQEHASYIEFFNGQEPERAAFNFNLRTDMNVLRIGIHAQFPPLASIREHLNETYGTTIGNHYMRQVETHVQYSAMSLCRNRMLTESGATDQTGHEMLVDVMRAAAVHFGTFYDDRAFRNAVFAKARTAAVDGDD